MCATPPGFLPTNTEGKPRSSGKNNPYSRSKDNYALWSSPDDEFSRPNKN